MRAWIPWLVTAGILFLLAWIRVGVHLWYTDGEYCVKIRLAALRIPWLDSRKLPKPEKKKVPAERPASEQKASAPRLSKSAKKKRAQRILAILKNHWQEILQFIGRVFTEPTLDLLRLELQVGGRSPDRCAMRYGQICAGLGVVLPLVENTFQISKREIRVDCDFDREDIGVAAEVSISLHIYEILALAGLFLKLGLGIFLQFKNSKKAVQQHESSSS